MASASENPDLFWGIRGAGANFGIVTSFEYRLHPVGPVLGGMVIYPMSREALRFCDEFAASSPDEATCVILLLQTPDGVPAVGVAVCYVGDIAAGEQALAPLRSFGPPLADFIAPQPYTRMQTLFDTAWPPGRLYYDKSSIFRRLPEDACAIFVEYAARMPTPLSAIAFQQLHGAAGRVGVGATAFPHRFDHLSCYVHPVTEDPADTPGMIAWARACWQDVQPYVEPSVYVNALDDPEQDDQRAREAYGPNYARLVELKRRYDPTNFFRLNGNVNPS
jgi:FAD/FMN-containing dehydrogenase